MLKNLYALFLGIILATFVGIGISTFYVAPKAPEFPTTLSQPTPTTPDKQFDTQRSEAQTKFDADQKAFETNFARYNRTVSVVAMVFAIAFLTLSLLLDGKIGVIADGLLLGGIFTLLYGMIRGFMTDLMTYRFVVITVGLIVALILGYVKFARHEVLVKHN